MARISGITKIEMTNDDWAWVLASLRVSATAAHEPMKTNCRYIVEIIEREIPFLKEKAKE